MSCFEGFDQMCDEWENDHPDEEVPYGDLFADWLAGKTGDVVIGGPIGEAPTVVAIP
jgi:hypothetical protein